MKSILIAISILIAGNQIVFAQTETQQRVENQDARVQQGVQSGTMTQGQAQRVENKDQRIENRVNNGTESKGAANRQLNRQSRKIKREKNGN